jgi:divalent metal cation (Fe/Co/Zn/Cd) transporter
METVSGLEGVDKAHDIRVRNVGSETFVDMHIEVPRTYTHDRAHRVATAVEDRVRKTLPNSDVLVHVDATESSSETIKDRIRLIAAETEGIRNVHSIYLSKIPVFEGAAEMQEEGVTTNSKNLPDLQKKRMPLLHLYLDVQMDDRLDLKSAHSIIDSFEKRMKDEIPALEKITTHMETETSEHLAIGTEKKETKQPYLEKIRHAALSVDRIVDCKDIGVIDINGEVHITLTIRIKPTLEKCATTIEDAHIIATNIQNLIIKQTGASRVIVHTEPD